MATITITEIIGRVIANIKLSVVILSVVSLFVELIESSYLLPYVIVKSELYSDSIFVISILPIF